MTNEEKVELIGESFDKMYPSWPMKLDGYTFVDNVIALTKDQYLDSLKELVEESNENEPDEPKSTIDDIVNSVDNGLLRPDEVDDDDIVIIYSEQSSGNDEAFILGRAMERTACKIERKAQGFLESDEDLNR